MSRRGRHYHHVHHVPDVTDSEFKALDEWKIQTALEVLFDTRARSIDRTFLRWIDYTDAFHLDQMSDKEIKKLDLKPWAFRMIHTALSALVIQANKTLPAEPTIPSKDLHV